VSHRQTYKLRLLHAWSNWILHTPPLWSACVEPGGREVHLSYLNAPITYLTLNTKNLFHINTIVTQYNHKHNTQIQHYYQSEPSASDWNWSAHKGTWQQISGSIQNSAGIVPTTHFSKTALKLNVQHRYNQSPSLVTILNHTFTTHSHNLPL
jgi:hypothetical protein